MIRLLALLLLLLGGCSPFAAVPGPDLSRFRTVPDVPFRPQEERDDCGPAAVASLLAQRGRDIPVAQIRRDVYSPALGGTLLPDLENFVRAQGFATRSGRGDLELLRRSVDTGRPVLIPVQAGGWGLSRPHFLVIYGYDERGFLAHAGVAPSVFIASGELLRRWDKMNRLYLFLE